MSLLTPSSSIDLALFFHLYPFSWAHVTVTTHSPSSPPAEACRETWISQLDAKEDWHHWLAVGEAEAAHTLMVPVEQMKSFLIHSMSTHSNHGLYRDREDESAPVAKPEHIDHPLVVVAVINPAPRHYQIGHRLNKKFQVCQIKFDLVIWRHKMGRLWFKMMSQAWDGSKQPASFVFICVSDVATWLVLVPLPHPHLIEDASGFIVRA